MSGDAPNLIKVCLCNGGEDSETPWAEDLGPAKGPRGSRKVRLVNVPFLHAKPTWGDVIVVSPVEDGLLTWDGADVPWSKIHTHIEEDGGRYAMIVDYVPRTRGSGDPEFDALNVACTDDDIICEGAWGPRDDKPGRAYLAVPDDVAPAEVMAMLTAAAIPAELRQVHPEPARKKTPAKPTRAARKPARRSTTKTAARRPGARAATSRASRTAAPKAAATRTAKKPRAAVSRTAKKSRAAARAKKRTK